MRAKALKPAFLAVVTAASLLAPNAFARPRKHVSPAKQTHTSAAKSAGHKASPKSERTAGHKPAPASRKAAARSERGSNSEHTSKSSKSSRKSRAEASRRVAEPYSRSSREQTSTRSAQARTPEPVQPAPAPQPALPPIEVHHDRKQHTQPNPPPPPETAPKLALAPMALEPMLYTSRGHLIVPPPLKGSHEILIHQNVMADSEGLERIQDDTDLEQMRSAKSLVPIPAVAGLQSDDRLPLNRRYCRPWTAQFLTVLARAHYARFHTSLQVNSAVRTVEFQHQLLRVNGNAAPADGDTASPHLTGQAVDLAKHGLSMTEIAWMRAYLLPLVQQGKIDVEEEFQQSCFHISIYKRYIPGPSPERTIIPRSAGSSLAAALP